MSVHYPFGETVKTVETVNNESIMSHDVSIKRGPVGHAGLVLPWHAPPWVHPHGTTLGTYFYVALDTCN